MGPLPLPQLVDRGVEFLPGENASTLQHLHQHGGLPHVGDGQLFDADEFFVV